MVTQGFPGGSEGKASACNAGDPGSMACGYTKIRNKRIALEKTWEALAGTLPEGAEYLAGQGPSLGTRYLLHRGSRQG